jgi:hypothetical protein
MSLEACPLAGPLSLPSPSDATAEIHQSFKTGLCSEDAAERISIASLLDLDARRHHAAEAGAATTGPLQVE